MSLVLEYLTVGGVRPDVEGFDAWTREIPYFQEPVEQEGHNVWWYRNPWTNVYFSVAFRATDPMGEQIWAPCGLEAMVNHLRPSYFVGEAAPVLAGLCREFGLLARDADTGQLLTMDPEPAQIERMWLAGNRQVREEALEQGKRVHRLPKEANLRWWDYSRRRPAIQEALRKEDPALEVPEVHFLYSRPLDRILTSFAWKDGSGTVFPQVDLVILDRTDRKFLGLRKERRITYVSYDALVRQVIGALRTVEVEGMGFRMLSSEDAWRAVERLAAIPQNEDLDTFQNIHSSRVVDDA